MSLKEVLGIELPIIQAPMAGVQGSGLAIAVSNAGGLGSLPGAMLGIETLRDELSAITFQTDRPYNVNFFCQGRVLLAPQAPGVRPALVLSARRRARRPAALVLMTAHRRNRERSWS